MAVPRFIDSVQHWTQSRSTTISLSQIQAKWQEYTDTGTAIGQGRYPGTQGLEQRQGSWACYRRTATEITIGADLRAGNGTYPMSNKAIFAVVTGIPTFSGTVTQAAVQYESQGSGDMAPGNLIVYGAGADTAPLWRGELLIGPPDTWQSIEAYFKIGAADGQVIVRIDGTEVCNISGVNTDPAGTGIFERVCLGTGVEHFYPDSNPHPPTGKTATSGLHYYANIYIYDGMFFPSTLSDAGDRVPRISVIYPDGPGMLTEWEIGGSNATNWQGANRVFADNPSGSLIGGYNQDTASNTRDLYSMQNLTTNDGRTLHCVQSVISGLTDDAFAGAIVRPIFGIGGTVYAGPNQPMPQTSLWAFLLRVFSTNLATGVAWTDIDINNAEFGVELVTGAGATYYIRQTCLEVVATNLVVNATLRPHVRIVGL